MLHSPLLHGTTPEQDFWQWFTANEQVYRQFQPDDENLEQIFGELEAKLKSVHPCLVFEFGGDTGSNRQFIISADGNGAAFPAVHALVTATPNLAAWTVLAFRQRGDAAATITINDLLLVRRNSFSGWSVMVKELVFPCTSTAFTASIHSNWVSRPIYCWIMRWANTT